VQENTVAKLVVKGAMLAFSTAATAAAQGVLTPQPCMPLTTAPWTPGSTRVTIADQPALSDSCQLMCQWGGQIRIQSPGQMDIEVD
jgi:hypothetical protein